MNKLLSLLLILFPAILVLDRCKKEVPAKLAEVFTTPVSNITTTTATSGGNILSNGGAEVSANGICWSTSVNPSTADSKTADGIGGVQFVSNLTGLIAGTIYHVRAYATNLVGTAYGDDMSFTTLGKAPSGITQPATNISTTSATLNGTVSPNDLSTNVTFEYGTSISYGNIATPIQSPVTGNSTTNISVNISGLTYGKPYHFRLKAENSIGTVYGEDVTFNTLPGSVTDIDGNVYSIVTIGTQIWMASNLNTTKYNDGTSIPNVTDGVEWANLSTGAYCDYDNNPANSNTYGRLYNWYVAASTNPKNVCPTGWHVSSDAEWTTLTTYLGGEAVAGGMLKEMALDHWADPNYGATNETGFTALPGGKRRGPTGEFMDITRFGYWWSSTELDTSLSWTRNMSRSNSYVMRGSIGKLDGNSIRCLMDL